MLPAVYDCQRAELFSLIVRACCLPFGIVRAGDYTTLIRSNVSRRNESDELLRAPSLFWGLCKLPPTSTTCFNRQDVLVNLQTGHGTEYFLRFLESLKFLAVIVNGISAVNRWPLASQPSLGAADAGYLAFVTDFGHYCRWTGSVWEFLPGDVGNGFRRDFAITPQEVGWGLMNGSTYSYLVVGGATLTTANFTTPNLTGSPAYHKSIAAYTGTIEAAVAPGITGSTGNTAPGLSGSVGAIVPDGGALGTSNNIPEGAVDVVALSAINIHHHEDTFAVDNHLHASGTLAVDGTARPPAIGWLPFFRR